LKVHVEGQLVFNGTFQMLDAALAGFGLAYVPEDVVEGCPEIEFVCLMVNIPPTSILGRATDRLAPEWGGNAD
jgi:hypothetical protein